MRRYWRLKDIPELHDIAPGDRRTWWREAVSRSNSARGVLATLSLFFVCIFGVDALRRRLGYHGEILHFAGLFCGSMLASLVNQYWLIQPRARAWLRTNPVRQPGEHDPLLPRA